MSHKLHLMIFAMLGVCLLVGLNGCNPAQSKNDKVLRVGIIASLSGPARPWGLVTVRCAQVVADYYNDRGGFDLGGEKVRIELVIRDDAFDAYTASTIAHDLTTEGVNYVIGPLADAAVLSAARVLDAVGVFYVHYGFHQDVQNSTSLGVLGMPLPEQSLPVLFSHLRDQQGVRTALIMAYGTEAGIHQKGIAELLAENAKLELIKVSRFDVSEETFGVDLDSENIRRRVERVVAAAPDALVLAGCPPDAFIVLVDRLRSGGYEGFICAQNFQDGRSLAMLGEASNGVYFVGGESTVGLRSEYYNELKARYLDLADVWSAGADTKLYALELILACIREAGAISLEETSSLYQTLEEVRFEDPFSQETRAIPIIGGIESGMPRQMLTSICISKMSGGEVMLVEEIVSLIN
jgi:branched-chain amino acid transport system substrate-binding protein